MVFFLRDSRRPDSHPRYTGDALAVCNNCFDLRAVRFHRTVWQRNVEQSHQVNPVNSRRRHTRKELRHHEFPAARRQV
jgi:hypothetical protein